MRKITLPERPGWRERANALGFTFAEMHGEPYWDETSAYEFSLREVETCLEDPSTALHALCREAVTVALSSEEWLTRLSIPPEHWDLLRNSWRQGDPELYGRFDLSYDGTGPAKLLEYNADTPTSLYESASFQWLWFEEQQAAGVLSPLDDQFNGIHEALVERFAEIAIRGTDIHFAADRDNPEDYATVEALAWAAREAKLGAHFVDLSDIGLTEEGQFADGESRVIGTLFKLYPWEDMLRDDFAAHLGTSGARFIEPPWKAILSNKGLLPLLWELEPGHPNLLPAFFAAELNEPTPEVARALEMAEADLARGHVLKPLFSREGAGISIVEGGSVTDSVNDDRYSHHPMIVQALAPLPEMQGFYPVIGTWIVGQTCAGMGLREDRARITNNLSRFKPHYIRD